MQKRRYLLLIPLLLVAYSSVMHARRSDLTADQYEQLIDKEKAVIRAALERDDFDGIALMYQESQRWPDGEKERYSKEYAAQPVHYAIYFKDIEIAKELVQKKSALLFQQDATGATPLVRAIYAGQIELVEFFITQFEEDVLPSVLQQALAIAREHALRHNLSNSILSVIVHHLVNQSDDHVAPLIWAIKQNDPHTVHALLREPNINIHVTDEDGNSALLYAVKVRNTSIIGFLAEKGAHCYAENIYQWTPLKEALFNAKSGEIVTILLREHIKKTDWARRKGFTPLLWAASQDDTRAMSLLIATNPKCLNDRDSDGNNAIYWASVNNNADALRFLKESGVKVQQKNSTGWTPLAASVRDGNDKVLSLLFDKETYEDERDEFGWTPLIKAARFDKRTCVVALLEMGVDIDEQDNDGNTALHWAARYGLKDVVLCLLDAGADTNRENKKGITPLFWACHNHHAPVVRILLEHGAEANEQYEYGWTLNYSKLTSSIKKLLRLKNGLSA